MMHMQGAHALRQELTSEVEQDNGIAPAGKPDPKGGIFGETRAKLSGKFGNCGGNCGGNRSSNGGRANFSLVP